MITENEGDQIMILTTERFVLRPWTEADAESLFEYASDPDVGPIAGWPPHKNVEESLDVIRNVFTGAECYAICEKENDKAIGAIELKLNGHTDMTERDDECELGYWLGKPFWGRGYMPEAATELIRHGFEELGMTKIWCGYYDGNNKSKRVQEKVGFTYHHTCDDVPVPLMNEKRKGHTNYMTKGQWMMKENPR
jgi:RimJ/RimL family protein N-acetyltransferase